MINEIETTLIELVPENFNFAPKEAILGFIPENFDLAEETFG
jgi:hypothetical protein